MPPRKPLPFIIEPFDPKKHNRAAFSCGITQVDNYFRKTANKLAKADNVRLYVMATAEGDVIGFYSINAHSVDYAELPVKYAQARPSHGHIPAAYISMIARDVRYRGHGYGSSLLADALTRIARAADSLGIAVVMLDVLDCGDPERVARRKALYESFGFMSLPSKELRMFLPLETVRALLAEIPSEEADTVPG